MATKLHQLKTSHRLFTTIKRNPPGWWNVVIADPDTYIEVRKGCRLDVYCNGGAIFGDVKVTPTGDITWKTHAKYLIKSEYIGPGDKIGQIQITDPATLKLVQNNIKKHYPTSSEKGYQAKLRLRQGYFLDSEFAFNEDDKNRFDLVWLDRHRKKIVFTELKLSDNPELLNGKIYDQLCKYSKLLHTRKDELEKYFKSLFLCKKEIGILPEQMRKWKDIEDFSLECRPLLVVGGCTQQWIDDNHDKINNQVKGIAYGAYYYGSPNHCNLIDKSNGNRYVF